MGEPLLCHSHATPNLRRVSGYLASYATAALIQRLTAEHIDSRTYDIPCAIDTMLVEGVNFMDLDTDAEFDFAYGILNRFVRL